MAEESSGILSRLADIATGKAQKDAISNSSVGELAKALGESMGEKFKSVQEAMAKLSSKGDSKEAVKAVEARYLYQLEIHSLTVLENLKKEMENLVDFSRDFLEVLVQVLVLSQKLLDQLE